MKYQYHNLTEEQCKDLINLLQKSKELFGGTLGA